MYVQRIVPHYVVSYKQDNLKSARMQHMQYQTPLPSWAVNRPDVIARKMWLRQQRGEDSTMVITPVGGSESSRFLVQKSDETLTIMLKDQMHLGHVPLSTTLAAFKDQLRISRVLELCYDVNIKAGTCSCPDCRQNLMVCKHMFGIIHHSQKANSPLPHPWSFEDLPVSLTQHAGVIIDPDVATTVQRQQAVLPGWMMGEEDGNDEQDVIESATEEEEEEEEPSASPPQRRPKNGDLDDAIAKIRTLYHDGGGGDDQKRGILADLADIHKRRRLPDEWTPSPPPEVPPPPPRPAILTQPTCSEFNMRRGPGRPKAAQEAFPSRKELDAVRDDELRALGAAAVVCKGTQQNKSPSLRPKKRARRGSGVPTGDHPNVKLHAFPQIELHSHLMYTCLPADQHRQLTPGWFAARCGVVTASSVAALAGFFSVDASRVLGGFSNPTAESSALEQLKSASVPRVLPEAIPMQWGRAHETNPLLTLLEPSQRRHISLLSDFTVVKLQECSLVRFDVSKLPQSIKCGLSARHAAQQPSSHGCVTGCHAHWS